MGSVGRTIGSIAAAPFTGGLSLLALSGGAPKVSSPSVPDTPKRPTTENKAVQQAVAEAAQRRRRASGYRGTILSQMGGNDLKDTIGS